MDERGLRRRVFISGIEPGLRKEAWKFLLGFYEFNSTAKQREELRCKRLAEYKKLRAQWETIGAEQAEMCARLLLWLKNGTGTDTRDVDGGLSWVMAGLKLGTGAFWCAPA